MDYGMCCQTVTVYRKTPTGLVRREIPCCFLQWQEEAHFDRLGRQQERKFLLVQPGAEQLVFPGDRVYEGIGPTVTQADWASFLPALVRGLGEVEYAIPYDRQGCFCHTEAGRK